MFKWLLAISMTGGWLLCVLAQGAEPSPAPRIRGVQGVEPLIARFDVIDFQADPTGKRDSTTSFQRALDAAHDVGGAVVFVPRGRYRFDGTVEIPTAVTLRGEQGADGVPRLLAYADRGRTEGPSFIRMHPCSGLLNFEVFHPEQRADAIVPYPWSIEQVGGDNITVENVTLVNAYQGIRIGPQTNELHLLRNVRGTPLKTGVFIDSTYDIGRLEGVHFAPSYWVDTGLSSADGEKLKRWMMENGRAVIMGRSDWEYMSDVHIDGYRTGFTVLHGKQGASNAQFMGFVIENCVEAVRVEKTDTIGLSFTDGRFTAPNRPDAVLVRVTETFTEGALQFHHCLFTQRGNTGLELKGMGAVSFQDCWFADEAGLEGATVIDATSSALGFLENYFEGSRPPVIRAAKATKAFTFTGNRASQPIIRGAGALPAELPHGGAATEDLAAWRERLHRGAPAFQGAVTTARLHVVELPAPPGSDATGAIQSRLDAARAAGGIVYLPAGDYRIEGTLVVPSGVELRGIWDVPHHTLGKGTVLLAVGGKGEADGVPLITLEPKAGVRGITVYYPEQDFRAVQPYPWTIRGLGEGVYAINVTMANTYQGIDFATYPCDRHFIDYAAGAPLKTGIRVSGKHGVVKNMQFNPHYWSRCTYPGRPDERGTEFRQVWDQMIGEMDALVVAGARDEFLFGNFVFAARNGLRFVEQNGIAPTALVIAHGSDATDVCVRIDAAGEGGIKLVNFQGACAHGKQDQAYIMVAPGAGGRVEMNNALLWGQPKRGVVTAGKEVILRQLHFVETGEPCVDLQGGNLCLESVLFRTPCDAEIRQDGGTLTARGNMAADFFNITTRKGTVAPQSGGNVSLLEGSLAGWEKAQLRHYRMAFGDGGTEYRANWYGAEPASEWKSDDKKQWSKPGARVYLPVLPGTRYTIALDARVPGEALEPGSGLYVGGRCILPIAKAGIGIIEGKFLTGDERYIVLEVRCRSWKPIDHLQGSQDSRDLGIAVRNLTLRAAGAGDRIFDVNTGDWLE